MTRSHIVALVNQDGLVSVVKYLVYMEIKVKQMRQYASVTHVTMDEAAVSCAQEKMEPLV